MLGFWDLAGKGWLAELRYSGRTGVRYMSTATQVALLPALPSPSTSCGRLNVAICFGSALVPLCEPGVRGTLRPRSCLTVLFPNPLNPYLICEGHATCFGCCILFGYCYVDLFSLVLDCREVGRLISQRVRPTCAVRCSPCDFTLTCVISQRASWPQSCEGCCLPCRLAVKQAAQVCIVVGGA